MTIDQGNDGDRSSTSNGSNSPSSMCRRCKPSSMYTHTLRPSSQLLSKYDQGFIDPHSSLRRSNLKPWSQTRPHVAQPLKLEPTLCIPPPPRPHTHADNYPPGFRIGGTDFVDLHGAAGSSNMSSSSSHGDSRSHGVSAALGMSLPGLIALEGAAMGSTSRPLPQSLVYQLSCEHFSRPMLEPLVSCKCCLFVFLADPPIESVSAGASLATCL